MTYEEHLNRLGNYDFRIKFHNSRNEESGKATSGTYVLGTSLTSNGWFSLRCSTTNINLTNNTNVSKLVGVSGNATRPFSQTYSMFIRPDNITSKMGWYEQGGGTNWIHIYQENANLVYVIGEAGTPKSVLKTTNNPLRVGLVSHIICQHDLRVGRTEIWVNGELCSVGDAGTMGDGLDYHSGDITFGNSADAPDENDSVATNYAKGYMSDWVAWSDQGLKSPSWCSEFQSLNTDRISESRAFTKDEINNQLIANEGFTQGIPQSSSDQCADRDLVTAMISNEDSALIAQLDADQLCPRRNLRLGAAPPPVDNPPTPPTNFVLISATQQGISYSFTHGTDDNGIKHYNIYYKKVGDPTYTKSGGIIKYPDNEGGPHSLEADTEYYVYYKTVDTADQESSPSTVLQVRTDPIDTGLDYRPFNTNDFFSENISSACAKETPDGWWFVANNHTGTEPRVGDRVYKLEDPDKWVRGQNHWYPVDSGSILTYNSVIQVDENGYVSSLTVCTPT